MFLEILKFIARRESYLRFLLNFGSLWVLVGCKHLDQWVQLVILKSVYTPLFPTCVHLWFQLKVFVINFFFFQALEWIVAGDRRLRRSLLRWSSSSSSWSCQKRAKQGSSVLEEVKKKWRQQLHRQLCRRRRPCRLKMKRHRLCRLKMKRRRRW